MSATAPDITVTDCIVRLTAISDDLQTMSAALLEVEKRLQPLEQAYDEDLSDFEAAMFDAYEKGEGKWPGEETRERLFRRTMPQNKRQDLLRLRAARKRAEKRIGSLKSAADAQRSVLSALKVEMESTR